MTEIARKLFSTPEGRLRVRNYLLIFILVFVTFLAIEIVPLHYGSKQLPWDQIVPIVKQRLPRILLIGLFVAAFIASPGRKKAPGGNPDA